jgi:hypothetical protein
MSEKTKPNAQAAEAPQPNKTAETTPQAPPSIVDIAKGLSEDKVKTAEELGFPVTALLQWGFGVESTLKAIVQNLPEIVQKNTIAAIETYQQQRQPQSQPSGQRGGGGGLGQTILESVLGGGGGGLSESDKWLMDVGRDTVGLSSEVFKAVIKEAVPSAIDAWNKKKEEMKAKGTPSA